MMREKSRARRRVRTRVALFLSLASLAGLYLIRLLGAALHAAGLSAVALSTAGTLLCFLLPALAGLFLLDGDQHGLIALRALSAQHVLCLAAAGALFVGPAALLAELPGAALRLCRGLPPGKLRSGDGPDVKNGAAHSLTTTGPSGGRRHIPAER